MRSGSNSLFAVAIAFVLTGFAARLPADTPPPGPTKPSSVEEFLLARFERVKELLRQGDSTSAFRLADALLIVAPDVSFRSELLRLRRLAEGRHLGANLLAARFEFGATTTFPRTALIGDLVVENLTQQALSIGAGPKSSILGQAQFRVTEYYIDGSEWSNEGTRNVTVASAFELQPGEVRRVPVQIDLPTSGAAPVLQRFTIRGTFGATLVMVGEEKVPRSIPWQQLDETVIRPDLEVVREAPYEHLQIGLLGADLARTVVAVDLLRWQLNEGLLGDAHQDRVIGLLTRWLDGTNLGLDPVLFRLLEKFTGVRCEPRAESWRLWAGLRKGGRGRE